MAATRGLGPGWRRRGQSQDPLLEGGLLPRVATTLGRRRRRRGVAHELLQRGDHGGRLGRGGIGRDQLEFGTTVHVRARVSCHLNMLGADGPGKAEATVTPVAACTL